MLFLNASKVRHMWRQTRRHVFTVLLALATWPALVLDDSEVLLKTGSVVVQRGTNHAWANRSGKPCRMLFVLVDGAYAPAIADVLATG